MKFSDRCTCGHWKNLHYQNDQCSKCTCPIFETEKLSEWAASYRNYRYWSLLDNRLAQFLWRRVFCPNGWHLWDEVLSGSSNDPLRRHYLFCDACDETVDIAP